MRYVILVFFLFCSALAQADELNDCLGTLWPAARQKGVSAETFAKATEGLQPDLKVLEFLDFQPEFKTPVWDYLAGLVDDERINDGKAMMRQWSAALEAAEAQFNVEKFIIAAVWGVESDYGRAMGQRSVVQSLATLSCFGRRQAYFRTEMIDALQILQHGDMDVAHFTGSWAGAFGQTQFMPSTFLHHAVDMDGDGRRDIVGSLPDTLGSTANYLHKSGWNPLLPWGFEVRVPADYSGSTGRNSKRPMSAYSAAGVVRADGQPLGEGFAGLIFPAGKSGPAFLVTQNFDAIYVYNASETYALAIAHLADRLRGAGDFITPWPTDDPGLSRRQRRALQDLLNLKGYSVGLADGAIGQKTREAIADFQKNHGLEVNGQAGFKILQALEAQN
jgi:lytic murein transglycosylase